MGEKRGERHSQASAPAVREARAKRESECGAGAAVGAGGAQGLFVVMEFCGGGTLADYYAEAVFTKKEFARIVGELLSALTFLHARGVAHRDLRPEHVLLSDAKQKSVRLCGLLGHARLGGRGGTLLGKNSSSSNPGQPDEYGSGGGDLGDGELGLVDGGRAGSALSSGHPAYLAPELFGSDAELLGAACRVLYL